MTIRGSVIKSASIKSHTAKQKRDTMQCTLIAYSEAKHRVGGRNMKFLSCASSQIIVLHRR